MSAEEFLAAAKARGFDLTEDDLRPPEGELDDAEAANVAGGHCFCVLGGGGGGTDGGAPKGHRRRPGMVAGDSLF